MKVRQFVLGAALMAAPVQASAATALVDLGFSEVFGGGFGGYVVQSFTATIDNMAGLEILVGGSNVNQTADISAALYSDAALTNLLASGVDAVDTADMPPNDLVNTFADVQWAPVALTLGDTYYLSLDTTNFLVGFYIAGSPIFDSYTGGQLLAAKDFDPAPVDYFDLSSLKFYTDPEFGDDPGTPPGDPTAVVPLPASAPLLLAGLGLLWWRRRS